MNYNQRTSSRSASLLHLQTVRNNLTRGGPSRCPPRPLFRLLVFNPPIQLHVYSETVFAYYLVYTRWGPRAALSGNCRQRLRSPSASLCGLFFRIVTDYLICADPRRMDLRLAVSSIVVPLRLVCSTRVDEDPKARSYASEKRSLLPLPIPYVTAGAPT